MLAALLLAAAAPATAEAAERAFAAMAQREGQWTAFRAYAAPDGIMFFPDPRKVDEGLAGVRDPKNPVMWWPAHEGAGVTRVRFAGRIAGGTGRLALYDLVGVP